MIFIIKIAFILSTIFWIVSGFLLVFHISIVPLGFIIAEIYKSAFFCLCYLMLGYWVGDFGESGQDYKNRIKEYDNKT